MKIEIGGGNSPVPGYVNCDIRNLPGVQRVIRDNRLPFETFGIDEILSIHCLEHFERRAGEDMLAECYRVLKASGLLVLAVPCLDMVGESFKRDIPTALKHIFGAGRYPEDHHRTFWTKAELKSAITDAGFTDVIEEPFGWPEKHVADWTVQLRAKA